MRRAEEVVEIALRHPFPDLGEAFLINDFVRPEDDYVPRHGNRHDDGD